MASKVTTARLQFATWLKRENPELFRRAMAMAERQTPALGDTAPVAAPSFWSKFADSLTNLATAAFALKSQKAILQTNIQRAQQGLPPVSMEQGAPVVRTQIDVTPEVATRLQESAAEGTRKLLLYGGLAAAAYFLFMRR